MRAAASVWCSPPVRSARRIGSHRRPSPSSLGRFSEPGRPASKEFLQRFKTPFHQCASRLMALLASRASREFSLAWRHHRILHFRGSDSREPHSRERGTTRPMQEARRKAKVKGAGARQGMPGTRLAGLACMVCAAAVSPPTSLHRGGSAARTAWVQVDVMPFTGLSLVIPSNVQVFGRGGRGCQQPQPAGPADAPPPPACTSDRRGNPYRADLNFRGHTASRCWARRRTCRSTSTACASTNPSATW